MNVKLPIKWMAIESMKSGIFTEKTDIVRETFKNASAHVTIHPQWSFGVTAWEVFSGGRTPYMGISPANVKMMVSDGYRLEAPQNSACTHKM